MKKTSKKSQSSSSTVLGTQADLPDSTINGHLTAQPREVNDDHHVGTEVDLAETNLDYGKMNLKDAKASGYTDKKGHAVSMAVKDPKGHPTGAYTDIGAGRSSAVVSRDEIKSRR